MATPPPDTTFKKAEFSSDGLGDQDSLDKFFPPLNAFLQSARAALSSGLTFSENMNAEVKDITVQTPSTDWIAPTLNAGWSVFSGFTIQYRKDHMGTVWIGGLAQATAAGTVFTLPVGYRPLVQKDFATAYSVGGTETMGRLRITTAGNVDLTGVNPTTYGSLDCCFPCADLSPGVLSPGFPVNVSTKVKNPAGVWIWKITDKTQPPTTPAVGTPSWTLLSDGRVQITNIPGLLLGRTYTIRIAIVGGS